MQEYITKAQKETTAYLQCQSLTIIHEMQETNAILLNIGGFLGLSE